MSHTPEPWIVMEPQRPSNSEFEITTKHRIDESRCAIAGGDWYFDEPFESEQRANARRIVACVNACEGILTETLEHAPKAIGSYIRQGAEHQISIDTYRDLCRELLGALKAQDALSKKGLLGAKLGEITAVDAMRKSAITKSEKILGVS